MAALRLPWPGRKMGWRKDTPAHAQMPHPLPPWSRTAALVDWYAPPPVQAPLPNNKLTRGIFPNERPSKVIGGNSEAH